MNNANMPAFASKVQLSSCDFKTKECADYFFDKLFSAGNHVGLTKREYFAVMAMQGFIAAGCITKDPITSAVVFADELLMRLEK